MIVDTGHRLVENFVEWLRGEIAFVDLSGGWTELTVPFLDPHNDYIQIYVRSSAAGLTFTDEGFVMADFEFSGINLTPARTEYIDDSLRRFGVDRDSNNALIMETPVEDAPVAFNSFVQAILAVGALHATISPAAINLFAELVEQWFGLLDVPYSRNHRIAGKTTFSHHFDFFIPKRNGTAEQWVRTMNRPNRDSIKDLLFAATDIGGVRPEFQAVAVLNDADAPVGQEELDALHAYNVQTIRWAHRDDEVRLIRA
ncbi:DUF1829 domain-containing protein [soil metagenome]